VGFGVQVSPELDIELIQRVRALVKVWDERDRDQLFAGSMVWK
jgi:hypothetical protein